jgi:AcrR family transcriptional regulator
MPARGHRTAAGARTRNSILDAAIKLLGSAGPDGFSASAIANEAGVSKATVFHHFRTVDEIPLVALDRFWASSLAGTMPESTSARDYLLGIADQIRSLTGKRRTLLRAHLVFLVKALFDPRLGRLLASTSAHMHELTMNELSKRLPRRVPPEKIETVTRMVEMVLDGMMIGLAVNRSRSALQLTNRALTEFLDLLLHDLEGA